MNIGVPRETRDDEFRVSLVPRSVARLVDAGHAVYVEHGAGAAAGFSSVKYRNAGAHMADGVARCDLVVGVKTPKLERLRDRSIVMAYLHVEKGQNPRTLGILKRKRILSYAFEEIRDSNGNRLVNLGFEAGVVGIAEGLRAWGRRAGNGRNGNPFRHLKHVRDYGSKRRIYSDVARLNAGNGAKVVIMGRGRVSRGVQALLRRTAIRPAVLWRTETANIENYLDGVDILVNAVDWYPREPHIVKRSMLKSMKKTALVLDISCDEKGAVETCVPTTWDDPIYEAEGINHLCISNLPTAIPRDSSTRLSAMILPHVMQVASGKELATGMMTRNGRFVYR